MMPKLTADKIRAEDANRVWYRQRTLKMSVVEFPTLEGMLHEVVTHIVALVNIDSVDEAPSLSTLNDSMPLARTYFAGVLDGAHGTDRHFDADDISIRDVSMVLHAGSLVFEIFHSVLGADGRSHIHEYKIDLRGKALFHWVMKDKLQREGYSEEQAMQQMIETRIPIPKTIHNGETQ